MTQYISMLVTILVTPEAATKHEFLFKLDSDQLFFYTETIGCFVLKKETYLAEEVNRTVPSPSVRVPCFFSRFFFPKLFVDF